VCFSRRVVWQVWKAPALITQFSPFALLRTYTGHHDDILSIEWTPDSQYDICNIALGLDRTALARWSAKSISLARVSAWKSVEG
jgi:hypothetical protein